ncbi:MAG: hypothetical protein MHM6MM_004523 [Cercozoa sp. M6MM]
MSESEIRVHMPKENSATLEVDVLPFEIQFDGEADVERFFRQPQRQDDRNEYGEKPPEATFRGKALDKHVCELNDGVTAIVTTDQHEFRDGVRQWHSKTVSSLAFYVDADEPRTHLDIQEHFRLARLLSQ